MSNLDIEQLENYLFSNGEFIASTKHLITGTETHFYLCTLELILRNKVQDALALLEEYQVNFPNSIYLERLQLRLNFNSYDNSTGPEEKRNILRKIVKTITGADTVKIVTDECEKNKIYSTKLKNSSDLSTLDEKLLSSNDQIMRAHNDLAFFKELEKDAYSLLDVSKCSVEILIELYKQGAGFRIQEAEIKKIDNDMQNMDYKIRQRIESSLEIIVESSTIQVLEYWLSINKDIENRGIFVENYLLKKFASEIQFESLLSATNSESITQKDYEYRLKNLTKIWNYAKNLPQIYYHTKKNILIEILKTSFVLENPDMENFDYYVKNLHTMPDSCLENFKYNQSTHITRFSESQIINYYLQHAFKTDSDFSKYKISFEHDSLEKVFAKAKLYYDSDKQKHILYTSMLGQNEAERLREKQMFKILSNLNEFREKLKFRVLHKNVSEVTVNIFYIDFQTYFLKNHSRFDMNVSFEGISPSKSKIIALNNLDSFKIQISDIEIDEFEQKNGQFAIEFITKTNCIRNFIKRGQLYHIHRQTGAGNMMMIFDSEFSLCKKAAIYYENKKYDSNPTGHIFFPFAKNTTGCMHVLAEADSQYEIITINQAKENYSLKCDFYCNEHSMITGKEIKVLVAPQLYINEYSTTTSLLKAVKISASFTNNKGLSSSLEDQTYDLSKEQYIDWRITIPPKMEKLEMTLSANIYSNTEDKWIPLSVSKEYHITNIQEKNNKIGMYELELSQYKGEYFLNLIGKNGEPYQNIDIDIQVKHKKLVNLIKTVLRTDTLGRVSLGNLQDVEMITASEIEKLHTVKLRTKSWKIQEDFNGHVQEIAALETETIALPYCDKQAEDYMVVEISNFSKQIINVHTSCVYIALEGGILIKDLTEGVYFVIETSGKEIAKLNIVKGKRNKDFGFILSEKHFKIYENPFKAQNLVKISEAKISEDLTVNLELWDPSTRVHFISVPYSTSLEGYEDLYNFARNSSLSKGFSKKVKDYQTKDKTWRMESNLNESTSYVMERRKGPRVLGNIFEKPNPLLNPSDSHASRAFVIKDSQESKNINKIISKKIFDRSSEKIQFGTKSLKFETMPEKKRTNYYNLNLREFIKNPTAIIHNQIPDSNGQVILKKPEINSKDYAGCWIIACGKGSFDAYYLNFDNSGIPSNDMSLQSTLNPEKSYREIIQDEPVLQGEKVKIADFNNAEIQFIDSVEKLYKVQMELLKSLRKESIAEDYKKWDFLYKWHSYSMEQKNAYYDKFVSHEMNFFLFHKDKKFFEEAVKPFIKSKIEKTLIDKFLLGMNLEEYAKPHLLKNYNMLEMSAIIKSLVNLQKGEEVQNIVDYFRMEGTNLEKFDSNQEESIFEIILSMKSTMIPETIKKITPNKLRSPITDLSGSAFLSSERFSLSLCSSSPQMVCQDLEVTISDLKQQSAQMNEELEYQNRNLMMSEEATDSFNTKRRRSRAGSKELVSKKKIVLQNSRKNIEKKEKAKIGVSDHLASIDDMKMEAMISTDKFAEYLDSEVIMQKKVQADVYQELDQTKEYAEMQYYNNTSLNHSSLATLNYLWLDYFDYLIFQKKSPFLSINFKYATSTFTELIAVLSLTGLPFVAGLHEYIKEESGFSIKAGDSLLAYHKEICESDSELLKEDVYLLQRFFEANDRFTVSEDNKKTEKYISKFYSKRVYGSQVVVTNFTDKDIECQVLYQIPEGCLPLKKDFIQKSEKLKISPKSSGNVEYYFYSPEIRESRHLPLYLLINKTPVVKLNSKNLLFHDLNTLEKDPTAEINEASLEACSKEELILIFKNILTKPDFYAPKKFVINFVRSRCFDRDLFNEIIEICRDNLILLEDVWKISLYHLYDEIIREWIGDLNSSNRLFADKIPSNLVSKLLENTNDDKLYCYFVKNLSSQNLVNKISEMKNQNIKNESIKYYEEILLQLIDKNKVTTNDKIIIATILIDQGRLKEAKQVVDKINPKDVPKAGKIHLDYIQVYLDIIFGSPDFKIALEITDKYKDYPVNNWRLKFLEIRVAIENKTRKLKTKLNKLTTMPHLSLTIEGMTLIINYKKTQAIHVRYYIIDMEVLYSLNPFISTAKNDFGIVKPSHLEEYKLDKNVELITIGINPKFQNTNCLIEILDPSTQTSCSSYYINNSMVVNYYENIGYLDVTEETTGKSVSMAYVKVFAKVQDDKVEFYKDGYTDISGRFDYASISVDKLKNVKKFSILISHDKLGIKTAELNPPLNI